MDAIKAARLLEPLVPSRVEKWLRAREHADPQLKQLIDRRILSEARRILGDYERKTLLSLPSEAKSKGAYELGRVVYNKPCWPFGLRSSELLQNTLIVGRSGAGKTNVAFLLLEQCVARRIPFCFFDVKQTARHLVPRLHRSVHVYTPGKASISPLPFNPFLAPPELEPQVYHNQVIDALAESFTLGDGAQSVIRDALASLSEHGNLYTAETVISAVSRIPDRERVRGWKTSALRALESLRSISGRQTSVDSQLQFARSLLRQSTIIELDGLSQGARRFLTSLLCLWLYHARLGAHDREKLRMIVVIEEAHYVLHRGVHRSRETIVERVLRQFRELGIGVVVVAQHPHLLSSAVLNNCYTSICLNLKDPADIAKAAKLSQLRDDEARYLSMLPVGQGIVKLQGRWRPRPFLAQFHEVPVDKGSVSGADVAAWMSNTPANHLDGAGSGAFGPEEVDSGRVRRARLWERPLDDAALRFLEDVMRHPDDGVKARYLRLGLSVHLGTRVHRALVSVGWLETAIVPRGNTRLRILRLCPEARRMLAGGGSERSGSAGRPGLAHDWWQRFWGRKLEREGWVVKFEAPRSGGRVDVLATRDGKTLAVEIETGSSDYVGNVRACLRSKFDRVLVVATSGKAAEKIERKLAKHGLLIDSRVEVVLQDAHGLRSKKY